MGEGPLDEHLADVPSAGPRVRTVQLLLLLQLYARSARKNRGIEIRVEDPRASVTFFRTEHGWRWRELGPGGRNGELVTYDEAMSLAEELWPMDAAEAERWIEQAKGEELDEDGRRELRELKRALGLKVAQEDEG